MKNALFDIYIELILAIAIYHEAYKHKLHKIR